MKKLFVLVMSAMMIFAMSTAAFATTEGTTPVRLSVSATTIDFTVSEQIVISGEANKVEATVTPYKITNNNDVGFVNLNNIKLNVPESQAWSIANYDVDEFTKAATDSNLFALAVKENDTSAPQDLKGIPWSDGSQIYGKETKTIELVGLVSPVSTNVSMENVATLVATVSA